MILADTSVWVQHFDRRDRRLEEHLMNGEVLMHPFVIGELACGDLRPRSETLAVLQAMPRAREASHEETLALLEAHTLHRRGVGWVDLHLLASARLSGARLLTDDRALQAAARDLGVAG
jgi:predicted nucleic acid-binding protein